MQINKIIRIITNILWKTLENIRRQTGDCKQRKYLTKTLYQNIYYKFQNSAIKHIFKCSKDLNKTSPKKKKDLTIANTHMKKNSIREIQIKIIMIPSRMTKIKRQKIFFTLGTLKSQMDAGGTVNTRWISQTSNPLLFRNFEHPLYH